MPTARAAILGLALLPLASSGALAQEEERYRLERTEDGYVRMDKRTGAMTLCQEREGELVCRPASERNDPAPAETDALRERIAALEERVKALEDRAESSVPLEEEFEQSLNLMERFFRRFIDIVRGLEEEERPQEPLPGGGNAPAERT